MTRATALLMLALLAAPAVAQTRTHLACGEYQAESWRSAASSINWSIARGSEKNVESAALKREPRFECIEGKVLAVEFVQANGLPFLDLYFPGGMDIGYGGQHLERNGRFVLPIQAKRRIPAAFRADFDYHCRMDMPADPLTPEMRKECAP